MRIAASLKKRAGTAEVGSRACLWISELTHDRPASAEGTLCVCEEDAAVAGHLIFGPK